MQVLALQLLQLPQQRLIGSAFVDVLRMKVVFEPHPDSASTIPSQRCFIFMLLIDLVATATPQPFLHLQRNPYLFGS